MTDRDTYQDELATGKTQTGMPAIPRDSDRVSSGDLHVEFTKQIPQPLTERQMLELLVSSHAEQHSKQDWTIKTLQQVKDHVYDQRVGLAEVRDFVTMLALRGHGPNNDELAGAVVLLVEDTKPLLNAWRRMLTECGAAVHTATSAGEAELKLELLREALTCCVLDVNLPDEQGFGLAQRARRRLPSVGIVVASGYSEFDLDEAAHRIRAAALNKPFDHRSTIDAILAATELGRARAAE